MDLTRYRTVSQSGNKEIVIKKSRFIGHVSPAETEEQALAFIEQIRKQHYNATHNCYAYVVGEKDQFQKFSDDGEPGGTAGRPILEVMKHQGLKNTVIVVTRYFGGIMLGAGGLVRAYTDGAVAAIESGKPVEMVQHAQVDVTIDYTWHGKLENELRNKGTLMGETQFTDKVTLRCLPFIEEKDSFTAWMTDLTQGQCEMEIGEPIFVPHELP